MELKYNLDIFIIVTDKGFNRTFMELKCTLIDDDWSL